MHNLHFLRPYFFWAFIPLLLALLVSLKRSGKLHEWQDVCDPHLLQHLMISFTPRSRFLTLLLSTIAGSIMIFSASGPTWERLPEISYSKKKAYVIVLDLSSAMFAQDITPSRLERAKFKVQDLLGKLKEGQVGLVVFTQEPFLVSPLTLDTATLSLLLPELTPNIMPVDGHNIKGAVEMASKLLTQAGYEHGDIFLITSNNANAADFSLAKSLSKKGVQLSILGVGTKLGAPIFNNRSKQIMSRLDEGSLKDLAFAGNGIYTAVTNDNQDLNNLLSARDTRALTYKKNTQDVTKWKDSGRLFLLLVLPFALLSFRRGWFLE